MFQGKSIKRQENHKILLWPFSNIPLVVVKFICFGYPSADHLLVECPMAHLDRNSYPQND